MMTSPRLRVPEVVWQEHWRALEEVEHLADLQSGISLERRPVLLEEEPWALEDIAGQEV